MKNNIILVITLLACMNFSCEDSASKIASAGSLDSGFCVEDNYFNTAIACPPTSYSIAKPNTGTKIATLGMHFSLDQTILRSDESPWTNVWLDAAYRYLSDTYGSDNIDFYIMEGGGFRIANQDVYSGESCPNDGKGECDLGLLKKGDVIYQNDVSEIFFPYKNTMQIRELSLKQLKDTLEVGARFIPNTSCTASGNGAFTQTSSQIQVVYDANGEAYNGDDTKTNTAGSKVAMITIHSVLVYDKSNGGFLIDANSKYKVGGEEFMWSGGTNSLRFWHNSALILFETTSNYDANFAQGLKSLAAENDGIIGGASQNFCDGRVRIQTD